MSPFWDSFEGALDLSVGVFMTTESLECVARSFPYPDGNVPRVRTIVRKMRHRLKIVEFGPRGSRSVGARYQVLPRPISPKIDATHAFGGIDNAAIEAAIERATCSKPGRKKR